MQKKSVEIRVLSFLMITILIISLVSSSVSAEKFVNKIQRITGLAFGDFGYCSKNLAKNTSLVTGENFIGCLDYCNEYYDFNTGELENYRRLKDECYQKNTLQLENTTKKLEDCYIKFVNETKRCNSYVKKLQQITNADKNCDKKYLPNINKYENIFANCLQVEAFIQQENPYNYEVYNAYINAKGTDCIKTTKKDKTWSTIADVNKDGRVNENDWKLIISNVENYTWGELAYSNTIDYCEITCFASGGADLCEQDEVCLTNHSLPIRGLGGSCCDVVCKGCLDSDLSVEREYIDFGIFTSGSVTDKKDKVTIDACKDKKLREQYCSEQGTGKSKNIACESQKCESGACVPGKCSDKINNCVNTGEPLCNILGNLTLDCNCIPPGYYLKAEDIEKELKKPFKDRKHQIEDALEEDSGFSFLSLAAGFIGGIVLGAIIGGTIITISAAGVSYDVTASGTVGGQIISSITGRVISNNSDVYNITALNQTLTYVNITKKDKLIRELTWIQYKLDNIKVSVSCDPFDEVIYIDCTGAEACKEKEETLYSG